MEEIRRYELFLIFQPELDEASQEALIERIDSTLTSNGGEIIEIVRRGKRRLQYAIQGYNSGNDVLYQVSLPTSLLALLERQFNLNEDIIRYLIVRRDDLQKSERLVASAAELEAVVADLVAETSEIEEAAIAAALGESYEDDADVVEVVEIVEDANDDVEIIEVVEDEIVEDESAEGDS